MSLHNTEITARLNPIDSICWTPGSADRPAAVLLPLLFSEGNWHLLFIERSRSVAEHSGQVAFPGGVSEPEDSTPVQTALRETEEEIGVPANSIRVLGGLDPMDTTTGYLVTPVVGILPWPTDLRLDPMEVQGSFIVPLDWLRRQSRPEWRSHTRADGTTRLALHFASYQGHIIWGATAAMTREFLLRTA